MAPPVGAGAGADEHEQHQQNPRKLRPQVEVSAGEAGGGDNRAHLKCGVAHGGAVRRIHGPRCLMEIRRVLKATTARKKRSSSLRSAWRTLPQSSRNRGQS